MHPLTRPFLRFVFAALAAASFAILAASPAFAQAPGKQPNIVMIEFPPMQPGASFNLEAVKAQIEKARAAHGQ